MDCFLSKKRETIFYCHGIILHVVSLPISKNIMPWRIFLFFLLMKATCNISLFNELRNAMVKHALREMPNECCGVLLGQMKTIKRVVPMTSSPPSPDSYFMDPEQQSAVFSEMEKQRETVWWCD